MLAYIFPREVRAQTIYLSTIVPDEEDEVLCGEVARTPARGKGSRLDNLPQNETRMVENLLNTYQLNYLPTDNILNQIDRL